MNKEKIGIGIVTYNRPEGLKKCIESLLDFYAESEEFVTIIVVNDGNKFERWAFFKCAKLIENETNLGVGKSKNKALQYLLNKGCEHIFLIEDDIFIKDPKVFQAYIDASKESGIQHFNFSQHGIMNKAGYTNNGKPNSLFTINYKGANVSFFQHCVGAFSYYSRKCLEEVGLLDERYYNACEHVDHTYGIIKAGMHPSFWYFADIENSQDYLGDEPWSLEKSTISSNPNHKQMMADADKIFLEKHHTLPSFVPLVKEVEVLKQIKEIKLKYGQ